MSNAIIKLTVNNHPGAMSHITGLFARRAFNVEAILCAPIEDGRISRIYLIVTRDHRLDQMLKQLEKLFDVLDVCPCEDDGGNLFNHLCSLVSADDVFENPSTEISVTDTQSSNKAFLSRASNQEHRTG